MDLIRGGTLQIRAGLAWKERMKHIIPLRGLQSPKSSPYLLPVCLEEVAKIQLLGGHYFLLEFWYALGIFDTLLTTVVHM